LPPGPEAGAQCGSSARWDPCGGPLATAVPTATPVQAFGSHGAHPTLGVRVGLGRPNRRLEHLDARRNEERVEQRDVPPISVPNQERRPASSLIEFHRQTAHLLSGPLPGGCSVTPGQVHSSEGATEPTCSGQVASATTGYRRNTRSNPQTAVELPQREFAPVKTAGRHELGQA
jgi:hypothetical protein